MLCCALTALAAPAASHAVFDGTFTGQCCYQTVEQGDVFPAWFELKNTGDQWWHPSGSAANPVILGTTNPDNRASAFATTGDWLSPGRPTSADQGIIRPGETGRFTFIATAPNGLGVYREPFRLVAEGIVWFGTGMFLDWTVIAAEPPTVQINGAPSKVQQGDVVKIAGTAKDNLAVQSVEWKVDGQALAPAAKPAGSAIEITIPQPRLTVGSHSLTLTAKDPGGRVSTTNTVFEVVAKPAAAPAPAPVVPSSGAPGAQRVPWAATSFILVGVRNRPGQVGVLRGLTVSRRAGTTVTVRCTRSCGGVRTIARVRPGSGKAQRMLRRPLILRRGTAIRVAATGPGRTGVFRTFRFRLTKQRNSVRIPVPRRVNSGCLAAGSILRAARCP